MMYIEQFPVVVMLFCLMTASAVSSKVFEGERNTTRILKPRNKSVKKSKKAKQ